MPHSGILLDIEGTTTPTDFVYSVLFPYAREHLREYLEAHPADSEVVGALDLLKAERESAEPLAAGPAEAGLHHATGPAKAGLHDDRQELADYAIWLMDQDRKSTGLKTLQGLIWREGYDRGELRGVVFPDVGPALQRWHAEGRDVRIFSSGSVLAQRLLFSTCPEGDLTRFIGGYFDTTTGPKKDAASYQRIVTAFDLPAARIIFISDVVEELDAARDAGMETRLAVRPGNPLVPDPHGHLAIQSFDELA